ncbi:hypothetical protein PR048_028088 [Dryococelus australis]|uniref:Odorant receptor n=1 Tax=Dryococelus australis TaxID=614101 RepID=A0ABQ9GIB2_9NEOP|nr:hypothetical protein PR048_028088 [Dryococelus australis]
MFKICTQVNRTQPSSEGCISKPGSRVQRYGTCEEDTEKEEEAGEEDTTKEEDKETRGQGIGVNGGHQQFTQYAQGNGHEQQAISNYQTPMFFPRYTAGWTTKSVRVGLIGGVVKAKFQVPENQWSGSFPFTRWPSSNMLQDTAVSLHAHHQGELRSLPGRVIPEFRKWESCRTMPFVGGFQRGSPVSPAIAFRRCSILTSFQPHQLSQLIPSQGISLRTPNRDRRCRNDHASRQSAIEYHSWVLERQRAASEQAIYICNPVAMLAVTLYLLMDEKNKEISLYNICFGLTAVSTSYTIELVLHKRADLKIVSNLKSFMARTICNSTDELVKKCKSLATHCVAYCDANSTVKIMLPLEMYRFEEEENIYLFGDILAFQLVSSTFIGASIASVEVLMFVLILYTISQFESLIMLIMKVDLVSKDWFSDTNDGSVRCRSPTERVTSGSDSEDEESIIEDAEDSRSARNLAFVEDGFPALLLRRTAAFLLNMVIALCNSFHSNGGRLFCLSVTKPDQLQAKIIEPLQPQGCISCPMALANAYIREGNCQANTRPIQALYWPVSAHCFYIHVPDRCLVEGVPAAVNVFIISSFKYNGCAMAHNDIDIRERGSTSRQVEEGPIKYVWLECTFEKPQLLDEEICRWEFKTANEALYNVDSIPEAVEGLKEKKTLLLRDLRGYLLA